MSESRRLSGNSTLPYDRQQPYAEHRLATPPAPAPGYAYYDRYAADEPPTPPFRDGYATEYGAQYWRTEREYFPSTPSPERYRPTQAEGWSRPSSWQDPELTAWPERREPVREPYPPQWNRPVREVPATRMFEPSDNWKQSHIGPSPYLESSVGPVRERPAERFPEPTARDFRERAAPRPREVYSPSHPAGEQYQPYSPPSASVARNRFSHVNPRSDGYRAPLPGAEWVAEDDDLYADRAEGSTKDLPSATYAARSGSQDRGDRRFRSRDSLERSASPAASRPGQRSSPGYFSSVAGIPKRESPELPHLEPLPPKPYASQPVRTPLGAEHHPSLPQKPMSCSPSHAFSASSSQLPHISTQPPPRSGLPSKPQLQAQPRPPQTVSHVLSRAQTKSPALQISAAPLVSPSNDSLASTPRENQRPGGKAAGTSPQPQSQPQSAQGKQTASDLPEQQPQADETSNDGRRSYLQRVPSFVPSTLAIDARLRFPDLESVTGEGPDQSREDEAESDMEMSLPASPMRVHSPVALTALDGVSKVKGLHEGEVTNMSGTERDRTASEDVEDAADTSDMDMSPPASPAISPAVVPVGAQPSSSTASPVVEGQKNEPVRPSLVIDTSVASPQLSRAGIRQRPPPSSTASTPPPVGDESDMEMSSPTSSAAPSPLPASPLLVARDLPRPPSSRGPPASSLGISGEKPSGAVAAVPTSRPDAAEPTATSKLSVPDRRDEAASPQIPPPVFSSPMSAATTPRVAALRDHAADRAQTSASASPRLRRTTASMERLHVEAGELSPPVSEETLREETEGLEKEADSAMRLEKETPPGPRRQAGPPVAQDVLIEPQKLTDIPLSEALRMVVRLRMMFPRQSQEERVEPVIMSNRHIAEPEEPDAPAAEALVVSVLEKERGQLSGGAFDGTKHSLRKRFAEHQAALAEKVERLRKEYLALHEKWMVHCSKLDEVSRANALEEAAATAGRTTRRSTAMGDAVRTDLEMEQILASLGNEELTDANHLSAKNAAMIPDMVSVTKGHFNVVFDDTNNLVEDPQSYYALETGIDDWTEEEKAIFLEKYAMYPKQFGIIADFLPNKTPAQCVTFYYLHKNTTIDFRKVVAQFNTAGKRNRRGRGGKQKGNALLADILKHDDEVSRNLTLNTTSGRRRRAPPPAPAPTGPVPELEARSSTAASAEQLKKGTGSRRSTTQNTPTGTPAPDPEAAAKRPRRRANPSAKAVAAMGQDNGDDEVDEDVRPVKRSRKSRKTKAGDSETTSVIAAEDASVGSATPGETRFIDQTELTARKKTAGGGAIWSDEDKALFLKLLAQHGDDFKRIAASMPNKTTIQVTSFYKANLDEMQLGKVAAKAPKRSRSPTPSGSASRVTTPSLSVKPTTPGAEHGFATDGNLHAPSDNGVESVANSNVSGLPSSSAPSGTPSDPPYPAASVDAFHHFQTPGGSSDMLVSSPLPRSGSSHDAHTQSPAGMGTPSTLTTTFPTFYSNLGPSNFAGGQVPPSAFARLAAPQTGGGANVPPMIMEFSDFAPQPWTTAPLSHDGQPQGGNGPQAPGLPTALATTEDLVRYLEHRTRLTAGQNTDTDFM